MNRLNRSTPSQHGVDSSKILDFLNDVADSQLELHGFMFLRHGDVIAEGWWNPYSSTEKHSEYSACKSLTSATIGIAIEEGYFDLDDKITNFFDISPDIECEIRVRDLLTMSTGRGTDEWSAFGEIDDWVSAFFQQTTDYAPGSKYFYSNAATYMLSVIIKHTTGCDLLLYMNEKLLHPLRVFDSVWDTCPKGITQGAHGMALHLEDLAKFAQLCLQGGVWNHKQIIPKDYLKMATTPQISTSGWLNGLSDYQNGYGYQFWMCTPSNAYRGDGIWGQEFIVLPDYDAVFVCNGGMGYGPETQQLFSLVWKHLIPAMESDAKISAIHDNILKNRTSTLAIDTLPIVKDSNIMKRINHTKYILEHSDIDSVAFDLTDNILTLKTSTPKDTNLQEITCGRTAWECGTYSYNGESHKTAGRYTWLLDNTLLLQVYCMNSPHSFRIMFVFKDNRLEMHFQDGAVYMCEKLHETVYGTLDVAND